MGAGAQKAVKQTSSETNIINGRSLRLAHGWELAAAKDTSGSLIRDYIRPAVRAVPSQMARQIGFCRISLVVDLGGPNVASQWTASGPELRISISSSRGSEHDVAMELLLCLGQALWQKLSPDQLRAYWLLLDSEFLSGISGELDEDALREKRALQRGRISATSDRRLEHYGRASFAGTAAEYVHCLWHDVTVVTGPEHLPAQQLWRRLELFSTWFPPDRGHKLCFAPEAGSGGRQRNLN